MATNFPTSLDNLTNPTGSSSLTSPDHAGQHADANDAIEALQAKVGVNSSAVTNSLDYKVTNGVMSALNVDNGVLWVDATNNRVGVNTVTPQTGLDVVGGISATSTIYTSAGYNCLNTSNMGTIDAVGTVTARAASDGVRLQGRAGSGTAYNVILTPTGAGLTANRTLTLPDKTGTVATTADLGLVYITEASATSGTTLDITSCFSASYDAYRIVISDFRTPAGASLTLQLLSGSTPATTNYAWAFSRVAYDATTPAVASGYPATVSSWATQITTGNPSGTASAAAFDLYNPFLVQQSFFSIQSHDSRGTSGYGVITGGGTHTTAASYNGIRFTLSTSTFTSFKVRVYGYRQT